MNRPFSGPQDQAAHLRHALTSTAYAPIQQCDVSLHLVIHEPQDRNERVWDSYTLMLL